MKRIFMTLLITTILTSCASREQQAARAAREVDRRIFVNGPACEKAGFKRDTDTWRNCVLRLDFNGHSFHH